MEKLKKRIANLKVAGKLKLYRITVLVMTLFLMLVALISTLVIRSNIEKITEGRSPGLLSGILIDGVQRNFLFLEPLDGFFE